MPIQHRLTPCLWFADEAEAAAQYYTSIFPNSRILHVNRYSEVGYEQHGRPAGSVMDVLFELDGHSFLALNGGPVFTFSPAVSFMVNCSTQEEIDYYWERLGAGGDPAAQQCGWLQDRFGVSWQIVPNDVVDMTTDSQSPGAKRAMAAVLSMKKIDIATLRAAYAGESATPA